MTARYDVELPPGWVWATLDRLIAPDGLFTDGDWVESKDQDPQGTVRLTQLADVGEGVFRDRSNRWMTPEQAEALGCTFLQRGDVLVARMPDPLGRACVYPGSDHAAVTAVDVCIIRPGVRDVDPEYLMWAINSPVVREQMRPYISGSTRQRISRKNLAKIAIPLAPAREQPRIVAALGERLSDLDAAERSIGVTVMKLAALRRSILRAAASGTVLDLPAGDVEALLARIASSRGRTTRVPAAPHDSPDETPDGWARVSLDSLVGSPRKMAYGVLQPGADVPGGVPFVRVGDIAEGVVATTGLKHIAPDIAAKYPRTRLQGGELLITLVGTIGRTGVAPQALAGANVARAVGVIPLVPDVNAHFVALMLQAEPYASALVRRAHEVARKTLNLEDVRALPIPLPDRETQDRIVAQVDSHMTTVAAASAGLASIKRRCEALRRTLLSAAVTGCLVEQDVSDEPAELLLQRIAEHRAAAPTARGRRPCTGRGAYAAMPAEESA